ncbi:MAG: hypothetical protein ACTSU2_11845 [Promethearchaeota archaeon]
MIELEIVPWLSTLLLTISMLLVFAGRVGKRKHFTPEFKYINEGDDFSWFLGVLNLHLLYTTSITWIIEEINNPGIIWKSGTLFFNIAILIGAIYLILPYILTITWERIVEIITIVAIFVITPFVKWNDMGSIPANAVPLIIVFTTLFVYRIIVLIFYLIKPFREFFLKEIKQINLDFKRKICTTKVSGIIILIYVVISYLAVDFF